MNRNLVFFFTYGIILLIFTSGCKVIRHSTKSTSSTFHKENNFNKELLNKTQKYLGVPYKYGGNDHQGIDCSGLICNVFKEFNIQLPRVSALQADYFPAINLPDIQKGDLVFFVTSGTKINHVGIVSRIVSEEEVLFIHASTSKGVIEDNMMIQYWKKRFARVCRPKFE